MAEIITRLKHPAISSDPTASTAKVAWPRFTFTLRSIRGSQHFDAAEDAAAGPSGAAHSRLAVSRLSMLGQNSHWGRTKGRLRVLISLDVEMNKNYGTKHMALASQQIHISIRIWFSENHGDMNDI